MTVHIWKPNASGFLLASANFVDGTAFKPGDAVVVHDGSPSAAGINGQQGTLEPGNFDFQVTGAQVKFATENLSFSNRDVTTVSGGGPLNWTDYGNTINAGFLDIGSTTASGDTRISLDGSSPTSPASFTNSGILKVQHQSTQEIDPNIGGIVLNEGSLTVGPGSTLFTNGYSNVSSDDGSFRNAKAVTVLGATGLNTSFSVSGFYSGSGTVIAYGENNTNASETSVSFGDPVSGLRLALDNASALFNYTVQSSNITFVNGDASVTVDQLVNQATINIAAPFGAVMHGFRTGDAIYLQNAANTLTWNQATHALTLSYVSPTNHTSTESGQFFLDGTYTASEFHLQNSATPGYVEVTVSTPKAARAAVADAGRSASSPGAASMAADAGTIRITPQSVGALGTLDFGTGMRIAQIGEGVNHIDDPITHFGGGDAIELLGFASGRALHEAFAAHGTVGDLTLAQGDRSVTLAFGGITRADQLDIGARSGHLAITATHHSLG